MITATARPLSHRKRRLWRGGLLVAVACGIVVLVALLVPSKVSQPPGSLNFSGASLGSLDAPPGEIVVFSAPLYSRKAQVIQILSVGLIRVPGFPTPRLMREALLGPYPGFPASTTGWPPKGPRGTFPIKGFRGVAVNVGSKSEMPPTVLYGVVGARAGTAYGVAGLEITYRVGSDIRTSPVYSGGLACVVRYRTEPSPDQKHWCDAQLTAFGNAMENMPAVQRYIAESRTSVAGR
jgi:hypothetical protein